MLQKKYRLQKNNEFQFVFKNSRPTRTDNLVFRVCQNKRLPKADVGVVRFGFVISNKIEKSAVKRNALKRQFRQIAADLLSTLKSGYDVVVVAHKNPQFPYDQKRLREQFVFAMEKAGILQKDEKNIG